MHLSFPRARAPGQDASGAGPAPGEPSPNAASRSTEAGAEAGEELLEASRAQARLLRLAAGATLALFVATLLARALSRFDIRTLWDDAYMFQRYARNLLEGHGLAWNPGGEPTYGLTSLLFLVVGLPLHALTGGRHGLAASLSSFLSGLALLALLFWLARRQAGASPRLALGLALGLGFCLARSGLAEHFATGMDTTFSMSFAALCLLLAKGAEERPTAARAATLGAVLGLAFWVRPEFATLTLFVPLAGLLLGRGEAARRGALAVLLPAAAVLLGVFAVNRFYFQSALPLPFYGKSTGIYGDAIRSAYAGAATSEFVAFLESFWPLLFVVFLDVASGPRRFLRESAPLHVAALASSLVCLAYYWLLTLPIMGGWQRFYFPALPALAYAAFASAARLWARLSSRPSPSAGASSFALLALAVAWLHVVPASASAAKDLASGIAQRRLFVFDMDFNLRKGGAQRYWYRLAEFSALPDDLVVATTEVGVPAAANPNKRIVDMAGLHDRDFALRPFRASDFFARESPDLLYLPHPHYRPMVAALLESPEFRDYEVFTHRELGTTLFGLALRRSSKHYPAMRAIVGANKVPAHPGVRPEDL